nr:glycoside hydrolase family 3 C-terminal domain-containing protein [Rhabdothermincola salaria]
MVEGEPLTALCVPCGAALGATWDVELIERVGAVLGEEARTKACRVLLAPTVNLHRSPLGGRNFESYSEDPVLAGRIATAFVAGAQSRGVVTTVKHFAGNESELDRFVADSVVDERTLRELYLVPFEMAVRQGGALGIMTSYNRLNGEHCADSATLLAGILRDEWGFEGFVVSDWFALAQTPLAIRAGLDLEMPGPARAYGPALVEAVRGGVVAESDVDAAVTRLLGTLDRVGALDHDPAEQPRSVDDPGHRAVARQAAIGATVLLRNDGVLPLEADRLRRVAVIGPNAARAQIMGGGSANLPAHRLVSPLEALRSRLGAGVELVHEAGVDISLTTPEVPGRWLTGDDGEPGLTVSFFAPDDLGGAILHRDRRDSGTAVWFGAPAASVGDTWSCRATATLEVDEPGPWLLSLVQTGPSRLLLDGEVVLDGTAGPLPPGHDFLGLGSRELTVEVDLRPDHPVALVLECTNPDGGLLAGAKLGVRPAPAADGIDRAVAAARDADAVVVVVGTDADWESEGADRTSMNLPGRQDELVERILAVAPDAVVVLNTGSVVLTPWAERARALLQVWFGGEEMADGLVDVLLGDAEPGGRLPTTVPVRLEHNPSHGNFPAENGRVVYGERLFVGYRWYEERHLPVAFPFGHGLSYTRFELGRPVCSATRLRAGEGIVVEVPVTNVGDRTGSEVVQLYVGCDEPLLARPPKELKAFARITLDPGETGTVRLELDGRSFAYWQPGDPDADRFAHLLATQVAWVRPPSGLGRERGWAVDPGAHHLHVGRSSAVVDHVVTVEVVDGGPVPG